MEKVLADSRRVQCPDSLHALVTRNNLALFLHEAGRTKSRCVEFETLLAGELRLLGPDHEDTLTTRSQIALFPGLAEAAADQLLRAAAAGEVAHDQGRVDRDDDFVLHERPEPPQ